MNAVTAAAVMTREGGEMGTVNIDAAAIGGMVENALMFCTQKARLQDGEDAVKAIEGTFDSFEDAWLAFNQQLQSVPNKDRQD